MEILYTKQRNSQIVISLLKAKGIRKVVASPGTQNISIVGSMQNDPFFEMYSVADERSAAYIACGLAIESGEPVVLSCTGATASRNYLSGLTEAYYRKLPIIALTSSQDFNRFGHLYPQHIDRSQHPKDVVKCSVQIPYISTPSQEWEVTINVNKALLELTKNGGGPVHINIVAGGEFVDFTEKEIMPVRNIQRYTRDDVFPDIKGKKIAIFVGSHKKFSEQETEAIEKFCQKYDSVVLCDHTSGYYGSYKVLYSLAAKQKIEDDNLNIDILIHIGEVSGDYYTLNKLNSLYIPEVWRVSEDGEIRDYFHKLINVYEMSEYYFFSKYAEKLDSDIINSSYLKACKNRLSSIRSKMGKLPFSNPWLAGQITSKLPKNSSVHLGILNTLRAWNLFDVDPSITVNCNVGGFGIDGCVSTMIGGSFANPQKIHFGVFGDLAFFYDMNSLGNRHVGNNIRILLINNGKGTEFRNYSHPAHALGERADDYIAAAGHYGNKSSDLVKHYAMDLGFKYYLARSKEEFLEVESLFLSPTNTDRPILLEVFTEDKIESEALSIVDNIEVNLKNKIVGIAKDMLGPQTIQTVKNIIKR